MRMKQNRYFGFITFLAIFAVILATTGCARYARQVSIIYDPAVSARGGSGDLYIVIPPDQQPRNNKIKWVIGNVNNYDGSKIDEIMSLQSPSELVRDALGQELRKAGFTVIHATSNPATQSNILNLINVDLSLDQQSDIVDIKANCRLIISIDVFKKGVLIKRLQYDSTFNKSDIKDRNLLAKAVLQETLQSAMQRAVPDIMATLAE